MCLYFRFSLLNPSVARDAQSGNFPMPARNLKASFLSNWTWEGGCGSLLQSDLLLPPLSPHPALCLLPRLGHRWDLHALPMSVILAPYLAASHWPSTPLGWRTLLLSRPSVCVLTSTCALPSVSGALSGSTGWQTTPILTACPTLPSSFVSSLWQSYCWWHFSIGHIRLQLSHMSENFPQWAHTDITLYKQVSCDME